MFCNLGALNIVIHIYIHASVKELGMWSLHKMRIHRNLKCQCMKEVIFMCILPMWKEHNYVKRIGTISKNLLF